MSSNASTLALKEVEPKARPQAVVKPALSATVRPFARCLIVLPCHGVALWGCGL
ncbi:hypothetical protein VCR4J5_1520023 [Vibrio crassostreae]|uniref:Uncharacterized protein n=1 Tax=Vibrio crassostreae TaxID=246167 RepID=A0ABP1WQI8_9VIBR|nr:hypothetical protein VCR4J5_1520023 [Vibrio crassostreae]CDT67114.1 hypothetical protein VCR9J2_820006 [Vibrio crassostreae]